MKVVVLGGYGVFGGYLAQMLIGRGHDVVVAGRDAAKAAAFCGASGGTPARLDTGAPDFPKALAALSPDVVIDAAGPFQGQGAGTVTAALAAGAHYLDLSDDAAFTAAITQHDAAARAAGRVVLSGVSSVPAISSAAVASLRADLAEITLIDSAICPGNRAPRGRSVMAAILGQVGAPLRLWRGGAWSAAPGWSDSRLVRIGPGLKRPAALIGAPDLALFPGWTGARSVLFRAGLELGVMHQGLRLWSALRARRMAPDAGRFARPLHWIASRLERFGTDRGGMCVSVSGRRADGAPVTHSWRAVAEGGIGPRIPALPALVAVDLIATGALAPGARPVLGDLPLSRIETEMHALGIVTSSERHAAPRLFEQALGPRWSQMPAEWRRAHDIWDSEELTGRARVDRGRGPLAALIAAVFRFPPSALDVPLTVRMTRGPMSETWERRFGTRAFRSVLTPAGPAALYERFGPFRFHLALTGDAQHLGMQVLSGRFLGLPLPRWLCPGCIVREDVAEGRFCFDVDLTHPLVGRLVRYRGWLAPRQGGG